MTGRPPAPLELTLLAPTGAADPALVAGLASLVNSVYAVAEEGLWLPGWTRTTPDEMAKLIDHEQVGVARHDGRIVGCVRVQQLEPTLGELGMLAAVADQRGLGVGRQLVRFAEEISQQRGATTMQLELLVPQAWHHSGKRVLHDWYLRLGYRVVRNGEVGELHPKLAPLLAGPCDFLVYQRRLFST